MVGHLGLEVGVGQSRAHACRIAVLDGRKAGLVRGNQVDLVALGRERIAQACQAVGGAGRARGPLVDLLGVALVMAQAQRQAPALGQGDVILEHQRGGHIAVVLLRVLARGRVGVLVLLVVEGRMQLMTGEGVVDPLHAGPLAHILVAAGRIVGRVAGVLVHVETVFVGVVVEARLEHIAAVQTGGAQEIQAVLVPVGPAPVAHGVLLRGLAGVDGIALLAFLAHIADGVFVRGIGRESQLEGQALVGAVRVLALAAGIGGLLLVIPEAPGQRKAVGIQVGGTQLVVPTALVTSQVEARPALAAAAHTQAHIAFEGLDRFARDQIHGTAQRIGAVQQRGAGLGHIDLGQVEGGEAAQVHIAVIGHVQRHAIHKNRHLARVEAAQADHFLVAVVAREAHARKIAHGIGHGAGVAALHLGTAHALHIAGPEFLGLAPRADFHRTQRESLAGGFGCARSCHLGPGRAHGHDGQRAPQPAAAKNKTWRMDLGNRGVQWHGAGWNLLSNVKNRRF